MALLAARECCSNAGSLLRKEGAGRKENRGNAASCQRYEHRRKGNELRHLRQKHTRTSLVALIGTLLALFGSVLMQGTARADYGPGSYDQNAGKGDVVCVGSDTVQYLGDFLADGDQNAHAGFNSSKPTYKLVNIDATADANARLAYGQTQTVASPALLDPSVVLRAGSPPVIRPNGSGAGMKALMNDVTTTPNQKINCVRTSSFPRTIPPTTAANPHHA